MALTGQAGDVTFLASTFHAQYLLGTEAPDNPAYVGDTVNHHVYLYSTGSIQDDICAVRASQMYEAALGYMQSGDLENAAFSIGAMTHYISDVGVFGHTMGSGTDWGAEIHHSDYESAIVSLIGSPCPPPVIPLGGSDAYSATLALAERITFGDGVIMPNVWMDANYDWSDATFAASAEASLYGAVEAAAAVIDHLLIESSGASYMPHAAIAIYGNDDFTPENGVVRGSGTAADPFIIEGWEINGGLENCIRIEDTSAHFLVRGVYVHSAGYLDGEYYWGGSGISTNNVTNGIVMNSDISGNFIGISLQYCLGVDIIDNSVLLNGAGISVMSSESVMILSNLISSPLSGWYLAVHPGIGCYYSKDIVVAFNEVTESERGVQVFDCDGMVIFENNVSYSDFCGIYIESSTGIYTYHNNLIDNRDQAFDFEGIANQWDDGYPGGGNYWSDYAGSDEDGDGIGDTPYIIDSDSEDRYPLMAPFEPEGPPHNTPPTASFTVTPISGDTTTIFTFDASGSWDAETPLTDLQVRWDWEGDGAFDTGWSTEKTATHVYSLAGSYSPVVEAMDAGGLSDIATVDIVVNPLSINASVDFNPNALNLRSMGKWITACIELPEGYSVEDILLETVALYGRFPATGPSEIGDFDNDKVQELMVKFDRIKLFRSDDLTGGETMTLTVSGYIKDGTAFEGSDDVKSVPVGHNSSVLAFSSAVLGNLGMGAMAALSLAVILLSTSVIARARRRRSIEK